MQIITLINEIRTGLGSEVSLLDRQFPHISKNIYSKWGKPNFHKYIDTLIYNDRPQQRQGFPKEVMQEIEKIVEIHNTTFPYLNNIINKNLPFDYGTK